MGFSEAMILGGALSGGFVSGLAGFGTGLTALSMWLYVLPPVVASPLVVICSVVSQLQTLPQIWHAITWRRVLPFIVGGVVGVPVGTLLLPLIEVALFKTLIGVLLIGYCSFMLLRRNGFRIAAGGWAADGVVGLLGGLLGGLAGLSGPIPSVWAGLRGWGKDEKRGVFQAFNTTILLIALGTQAYGGFLTAEVGRVTLIALPGTLIGSWIGRKIYDRLGARGFDQIVLGILLLSGIALIVFTHAIH